MHRSRLPHAALLAAATLLLAAATAPAAPVPAQETFSTQELAVLEELRHQADLEFKNSPASPLGAFGRIDLAPGGDAVVPDKAGRSWIQLTYQGDGKFYLRKSAGAEVRGGAGDEEPASEGVHPSGTLFVSDEQAAHVDEQNGHGVVLLFDRRAPELRAFEHLRWFAPDARYRAHGRFERSEQPRRQQLGTSLGRVQEFYRIGTLHFELEGRPLTLGVYSWEPQSEEATIFFRDQTSGRETLGAGRYLDVVLTDPSRVLLDFNRAYNPYCAYTDAYNCPLPPRENYLPVAVEAGERKYPRIAAPADAAPTGAEALEGGESGSTAGGSPAGSAPASP